MAASAASTRSVVFRVTGLSVGKAEEIVTSLTAIINQRLSPSELLQVKYTVFTIPSYDDIHTSSALVDFENGIPAFLNHLDKHPLEDHPVETDHGDINFDRHFFGFTQLYYPDLARPINVEQVLQNFMIPPVANLFRLVSSRSLASMGMHTVRREEKDSCVECSYGIFY
jgi:hypothetical protein